MGWLEKGLLLSGSFTGLFQTCAAVDATAQGPVSHGGSWEPEYVLVATAQNITINCESRYSVVFNGTSPGPVLHLQEGKTTWVRVYNEMVDKNITTVCCIMISNISQTSLHTTINRSLTGALALAWAQPKNGAILRRHTTRLAMAHSPRDVL